MPSDLPPSRNSSPEGPSALDGFARGLGRIDWGWAVSAGFALALITGGAVVVWKLQPEAPVEGRPLGEANGYQIIAVPARDGEELVVLRDGKRLAVGQPAKPEPGSEVLGFTRVEMSDASLNVGGGPEPDIVAYGWTGGMHCCITHFVFDGGRGRLLGTIEQGNGDPAAFVHAPRGGAASAVMPLFDDAAAHVYGSFAGSPMPRIVVAWDGRRFGLDIARMRAETADGPPPWIAQDQPLLDAMAAAGFEDDFKPPPTPSRGDLARAYGAHVEGLRAAMAETAPNAADPQTLVPLATYLNEQVYKGQAVAGVASVSAALAAIEALADNGDSPDDPDRAASQTQGAGAEQDNVRAALAFYFETLSASRWLADLDTLNNGALKPLIAEWTAKP